MSELLPGMERVREAFYLCPGKEGKKPHHIILDESQWIGDPPDEVRCRRHNVRAEFRNTKVTFKKIP